MFTLSHAVQRCIKGIFCINIQQLPVRGIWSNQGQVDFGVWLKANRRATSVSKPMNVSEKAVGGTGSFFSEMGYELTQSDICV